MDFHIGNSLFAAINPLGMVGGAFSGPPAARLNPTYQCDSLNGGEWGDWNNQVVSLSWTLRPYQLYTGPCRERLWRHKSPCYLSFATPLSFQFREGYGRIPTIPA